jgi:hypothetical protein
MPISGISKYVRPETRRLVDAAWDEAWRELKKGGLTNAASARRNLARAILALASAGETDVGKLKWLALLATREGRQAEKLARQERRR